MTDNHNSKARFSNSYLKNYSNINFKGTSKLATIIGLTFFKKVKVKLSLYRPKPSGLQEVEAPRIFDDQHVMVARLSPYALVAFTPQRDPWYPFLLEAELIPGPKCSWKD
jgi:hypothetical protein